ncbi:MAG: carbohydrate-binding protein, partial [Gammaproteobacteria bacterium]|nr:carbohydrate-binding protein [Gammaproteobacteria bacterium]
NYRAEVDLACTDAAAGSRMRLEIEGGAGAPEFTVPATGGWQSYRTIDVGRVELPMGSHRAILRALSKPGEAVANIRSIRLIRVDEP